MNGPERTPWFDGTERPAHIGVYRRKWPGGPYACWDGRHWRADAATPEVAAAHEAASRVQDAAWSGLAAPPAVLCLTCRGHSVIDLGVDEETGADLISECPDC